METTIARTPVLTLYSDGSVEAPGVKTYGELLARLNICTQIAADIQRQFAATPLPSAPQPDAPQPTKLPAKAPAKTSAKATPS